MGNCKICALVAWLAVAASSALISAGASGQAKSPAAHDYFRSQDFQTPMLSMELQYFRVPKEKWDLMLARMAQYNADTISTYICWSWHEYEEGKFDFTGKTIPERDLVGFIELVQKHNLKLVIKPGPFIDAELNAGGVPPWLWEHYPETKAVTMAGRDFIHGDSKMPRLSYLHPKYLERVNIYFKALADAVAKYQYPGGPVIAVQVDNETPGDGMLVNSWYFNWNLKADYNPYYTKILWPEWLKQQYGSIDKLNAAYGSSYGSFADLQMPREWDNPGDARQFQVWIDLDKFGDYQPVEALRRFTDMLRESGIYVPAYQDLLCMPWDLAGLRADIGGMAEAVGGWIGSNNYAEIYRPGSRLVGGVLGGLNWEEYVHLGAWRVKLTGSLSSPYPAFVPEITVAGNRFYFQSPIAWGADAVNIYIGSQINPDNKQVSPNKMWGMEACVTPEGEIRDCLFNGKLTYIFMEHSKAFMPDREKPEIAIGYSHLPENAWNWEYKWNFQKPHEKAKLKYLQDLVKGSNTGERTQMMAWDLIRQKVDFDVIDLEHLKPGQLGQYKLVLIPSTPFGPIPNSGDSLAKAGDVHQLYLSPGNRDYRLNFFEQKGVKLRQAWADDPEVDVVQRRRGPETATALSVINRGAKEFKNTVYFNRGDSRLHAALGPKVIGFVSVKAEGLTGALIENAQGLGEFRYNSDLIAFTGSFAAIAIEPGYAIISALDKGRVIIKSKHLSEPAKLVRLTFGGERRDAGFEFKDGALSFEYAPGDKAGRTDMYVALGREMTLERAIGNYLQRTMLVKK